MILITAESAVVGGTCQVRTSHLFGLVDCEY